MASKLSPEQLLGVLQQAGFRGRGLQIAYGIANRESGRTPSAFNGDRSTGDQSYGLFQINMLGNMGPARLKQFGLQRNEQLLDALTNAKAAYRMSGGGQDFGAWGIGPNAYRAGAGMDTIQKYIDGMPKPGDYTGKVRTAAGQAYDQSPAAVVNGPNPYQLVALRQQAVGSLLAMSQASVSGQVANPALLTGLMSASNQLKAAQAQVVQAEQQARVSGGTTSASGGAYANVDADSTVGKILQIAGAQIGKPYVWGAETPDEGGFDCSGLIDYAFRKAGVNIPGGRLTTYTAAKLGVSVKGKPYQPGDWIITNGGEHMVMYVGGDQVIAAPRRGEVVQYQPLSRFDGSIVDVRRFLKP